VYQQATIVIDPQNWDRATPANRANTLIHEMGHAYGFLYDGRGYAWFENSAGRIPNMTATRIVYDHHEDDTVRNFWQTYNLS
jgi:hypothetical protein